MAYVDVIISFLCGPSLGPLVMTILMAIISRPANLEMLLFGHVPEFLSKLLTEKNVVHALAGGIGGITSLSIFFPLDTARTRLQIDDNRKAKTTWKVCSEIAREEGVLSLYRGILPVLSSLYCTNFVYFYTFHGLKAAYVTKKFMETAIIDLGLGMIAGILTVLVTTPLWVANTRIKLQGVKLKTEELKDSTQHNYTGLVDAIFRIYKEEGFEGLWSGTRASLVLAANPAIQFAVYETVKRYLLGGAKHLPSWQYFLIGAFAKTVSTIITYPCQLVQCKQRLSAKDGAEKPHFFVLMVQIFRESGVKGLYKGLEAKLTQTVLTAAFMFLTYEKILAFAFSVMGVDKQK